MNNTGVYNIENSLPVIAVANILELSLQTIQEAFTYFKGIKRRFQFVYKSPTITYIDDYAHHPEELKVAINSVKEMFPSKKTTVIFQPHLFTRTRDYVKEFADILGQVDTLILLPIYPARELPITGINSKFLLDKIDLKNKFLFSKQEATDYVKNNINNIEILLTVELEILVIS